MLLYLKQLSKYLQFKKDNKTKNENFLLAFIKKNGKINLVGFSILVKLNQICFENSTDFKPLYVNFWHAIFIHSNIFLNSTRANLFLNFFVSFDCLLV
jgi:hypothetical protein